ncbi:putative spore germination protein GerPB [Paenibacillus tyrfis]|uniref:spore germination protein GerPB n=1 Tax=Paenibacillus TaxID=44249 RepID=UPI002491DD9D|nr:spore germination protein GerPB [Paenibacillus tyrfis]GLI09955.1 putative spore germination protein GerPB [Paenibacillus tyrfis]GMX66952.1 spore germination protein GerPB [Paenibacillus elgii]
MQLIIHQSIVIQNFKIGSVSNSSVLQIGTAGTIRALANLYNTGGFTGPAPQFTAPATTPQATPQGVVAQPSPISLVPLPTPSR